jgi:hypothetical protein
VRGVKSARVGLCEVVIGGKAVKEIRCNKAEDRDNFQHLPSASEHPYKYPILRLKVGRASRHGIENATSCVSDYTRTVCCMRLVLH